MIHTCLSVYKKHVIQILAVSGRQIIIMVSLHGFLVRLLTRLVSHLDFECFSALLSAPGFDFSC